MNVADLEGHVRVKLTEWAKAEGVDAPPAPAFTPPPPHVKDADVSSNWPLQVSKPLRRSPLQIAQTAAEMLRGLPGVAKADAVKPGFLNLSFSPLALTSTLDAVLASPATFGSMAEEAGFKKVRYNIEFVSANPTGPLHMASGRAAALGDSMARILRRLGHEADREYYVNDAGRQVGLLGQSLKARFEGKEPPEDGYQGEYLIELAKGVPPEGKDWDAGAFSRFAIERMLELHKADMKAFRTEFETWFLESRLHQEKALDATLQSLQEKGVVHIKDGATWFGSADTGDDDKDRVLVRSDGRPTYFLADLAYHKDKLDRGYEVLIDIWGADHHGYVGRMKAGLDALGADKDHFFPLIHQLVHLFRGDEKVKMSKRAGTFVTLKELVDEVGADACRYFFAMRTPNSHMNFDVELAKSQTKENPVYYVQYVHARICSIGKQAAKEGLSLKGPHPDADRLAELLTHETELRIMRKMAWFREALSACRRDFSPHHLANYLHEFASLFHPFYEECHVVDAAHKDLSEARLALCAGVQALIAQGLGLLGVSAPESM